MSRPPTPGPARLLVAAAAALTLAVPVAAVGSGTPPAAAATPDDPTVAVARDGSVTYVDPLGTAVRELTGTLTTYVVESPSGGSTQEHAVETASGRLVPVEVRGDLPARATQGTVTATVTADGRVLRAEVEPQRPAAAAAANAHRVYVAKVTNAGAYGADDATIAGTIDRSLQRWVAETDSAIPTFARVGGFATYAPSGGCGDASNLWNQAAASFPGVGFGSGTGNHLLVLAPKGCVFGVAQVGRGLTDGGRLVVSYDAGTYLGGLMHELGHNLGLGHANRLECATTCTAKEYGNYYDFMGVTWSGSAPTGLDSAQRAQLGLAGACETPTIALAAGQRQLTATYDVFGRGTDSGTRGLAVVDPGTGQRYVADWRNRAGRDAGGFYGSGYSLGTWTDQPHGFGPGLTVERVSADGRTAVLLPSAEATTKGGHVYSRELGEDLTVGGARVAVTGVDGSGADQSAQVTVTLSDPRVTDAPALPTQTSSVAVAGTPAAGATLTAVTTGWAAATCFRYQWRADGVAIPGARRPSYVVPADLADAALTVQVVGQAAGYAARTVDSSDQPPAPTPTPVPAPEPTPAPVTPTPAPATGPVAFEQTAAPRVTGTARVGRTLRVVTGAWAPSPTAWTYVWRADGRVVSGATRSTYKVTRALRGKRVTVVVTGTRAGYVAASRTSPATVRVR